MAVVHDALDRLERAYVELSTNPQELARQALLNDVAQAFADLRLAMNEMFTLNGLTDP